MATLSVVISAFNEEKNLAACLDSVVFADEIIVVDHQSTDKTASLARKYTKRVFTQQNDPAQIDLQKNFGFSKATGDWILSLDADERVPEDLAREIKEILNQVQDDRAIIGYKIPRKNIIFGKWIEHSIWWPDYQLRLFKRGKGEFVQAKVHEQLQVEGSVGTLESPLLHENYQSLSQYVRKMDMYTENEANVLLADNVHMHWTSSIRLPVRDFLKTFFLQEGYKDGLHGLVLSILQAFYTFLIFAKVWEKQGFALEGSPSFLPNLFQEWTQLQNEISYWFFTVLLNTTKNPIKQIYYKIVRKKIAGSLSRDRR